MNEDGSLSFIEFLCAVIFLEPHARVPPRTKLRIAFNVFNQFKVKAVHKQQILLLMAWLSRVTYALRDHLGVQQFYYNAIADATAAAAAAARSSSNNSNSTGGSHSHSHSQQQQQHQQQDGDGNVGNVRSISSTGSDGSASHQQPDGDFPTRPEMRALLEVMSSAWCCTRMRGCVNV